MKSSLSYIKSKLFDSSVKSDFNKIVKYIDLENKLKSLVAKINSNPKFTKGLDCACFALLVKRLIPEAKIWYISNARAPFHFTVELNGKLWQKFGDQKIEYLGKGKLAPRHDISEALIGRDPISSHHFNINNIHYLNEYKIEETLKELNYE